MSKSHNKSRNVYAEITSQLIAAIEANPGSHIPWVYPGRHKRE
jgi:hypothetical protein